MDRIQKRKAVAENPNTPPDVLEKLAQDVDRDVRVAVAENPNTSPDTFKILVQDQSHFIRMTVAANPKIPADLAESLSKGKDKWLRRNLARYTTYHEIIKYLAKDEFEFVREAVAENPNTPPDVLEKLTQDVDKSAKKKEITLDDLLKSESEVLNSIGLELHNEEEPAKPRKKQNHVSNIHHTSGNNSFHSSGGIRHSSSSGSRKPIKPEPSKFYLEIKDKYGIKTEYIQKYGSRNYKNRCWDILRLWIDIIKEKINEDSGNVSFKIYKRCLKELKFIDRYEIRFLCSICRLFYGINNNLMDDVWNDILLRVNVKGHKGDSAACISDFIKLAFEIKKIKGNKSYFINVVENTINHPFWGESGYIDQELENFLDNLHQEDN